MLQKTFASSLLCVIMLTLLSCSNLEQVSTRLPTIELFSAYAIDPNTAEANGFLSNVAEMLPEVGLVWSEKPNPTTSDFVTNLKEVNRELNIALKMNRLIENKTYYMRLFFKRDGETIYSNEIKFIQKQNREWQKMASVEMFANQRMLSDYFTYLGYSDVVYIKKIDLETNFVTDQLFYIRANQWDLLRSYSPDPPAPSKETMRYNPVFCYFGSNPELPVYGAGYKLDNYGNRIYLKDIYFTPFGRLAGLPWTPYSGADAPTVSFGTKEAPYILENLPNGKLWRYTYFKPPLEWETVSTIPYNKPARYIAFDIGETALILIEPEDEKEPLSVFEYLPLTRKWVQKANFVGENRRLGTGFVYENIAYYGLGKATQGVKGLSDLWAFNYETNQWKKVTDFPGNGHVNMIAGSTSLGILIGYGQRLLKSSVGGEDYRDMQDWWLYVPK